MVVCTNDGFSGADSIPLEEGTFLANIYDAGSETNVIDLDYWVPLCGSADNNTDDQGGSITAHPGQASESPDLATAPFDFPAGTQLLQVDIIAN